MIVMSQTHDNEVTIAPEHVETLLFELSKTLERNSLDGYPPFDSTPDSTDDGLTDEFLDMYNDVFEQVDASPWEYMEFDATVQKGDLFITDDGPVKVMSVRNNNAVVTDPMCENAQSARSERWNIPVTKIRNDLLNGHIERGEMTVTPVE